MLFFSIIRGESLALNVRRECMNSFAKMADGWFVASEHSFVSHCRALHERNVSSVLCKWDKRTPLQQYETQVFLPWTNDQGRARTQSPTTRNYAVEIPTFGEFAEVNKSRSAMAEPRPGWTAFVIMVSPLPGKYDLLLSGQSSHTCLRNAHQRLPQGQLQFPVDRSPLESVQRRQSTNKWTAFLSLHDVSQVASVSNRNYSPKHTLFAHAKLQAT